MDWEWKIKIINQIFLTKFASYSDLNQDASARQESQSQLFHDFLLRANRYNQLEVISNEKLDKNNFCYIEKKIILVEVKNI